MVNRISEQYYSEEPTLAGRFSMSSDDFGSSLTNISISNFAFKDLVLNKVNFTK